MIISGMILCPSNPPVSVASRLIRYNRLDPISTIEVPCRRVFQPRFLSSHQMAIAKKTLGRMQIRRLAPSIDTAYPNGPAIRSNFGSTVCLGHSSARHKFARNFAEWYIKIMSAKDFAQSDSNGNQSIEDWLRALTRDRELSRAIHDVLQAAISAPELASYASATQLGEAAGVNVATVTRAAQALGFSGWPEWRQEIRARYLGLMSAPEVADAHRVRSTDQPLDDTLNRHIDHLGSIRRTLDRKTVRQFAKAIAGANRRLIVASGSFASVGRILGHHAGLASYRCEILDDAIVTSNALADLAENDVVIPITFWRLYKSAILAASEARKRGAKVCLISDSAVSPVAQLADHIIVVPSEGSSFFPSMVPSLSVVEGICAELAALNPNRTAQAIAKAERQWLEFDLLHFNSARHRHQD